MALIRTTTTAKVGANDLLIPVSSTATGFPPVGLVIMPQQQMMIDNEVMFVVQVPIAGQVLVRSRGSDGTVATSHDINAPVVVSNAVAAVSDFPVTPPGSMIIHPWELPDQYSYGITGALVIPVKDTKAFLAGPQVMAMTLGAPSLASNGIELFITAQTAFAHTITTPGVTASTGLFNTSAAGGPFTVATFNGQPGSSMLLMAQNGAWNVVGTPDGVTFS